MDETSTTRALALPEILERILVFAVPLLNDHRLRLVSKYWLSLTDPLIVNSLCNYLGLFLGEKGFDNQLLSRDDGLRYKLEAVFKRNPGLCTYVRSVYINRDQRFVLSRQLSMLASFSNLEQLSVSSWPILVQLSELFIAAPFTMPRLQRLDVILELNSDHSIFYGLQAFIASLTALRKLQLTVVRPAIAGEYHTSDFRLSTLLNDTAGQLTHVSIDFLKVEADIVQGLNELLSQLDAVLDLDLIFSYSPNIPNLAAYLPSNLQTLAVSGAEPTTTKILEHLLDPKYLPNLTSFPEVCEWASEDLVRQLIQCWSQRHALADLPEDLESIRDLVRPTVDAGEAGEEDSDGNDDSDDAD